MGPQEYIKSNINNKLEQVSGSSVDYLIEQFPLEMQETLDQETKYLDDDAAAVDYLTTRFVNRKYVLQTHNSELLQKAGIEVIREIPHAISLRIEKSFEKGESAELGRGKNGEVIRSINSPGTCYKVLFLERAQDLAATAAREAHLQYQAHQILATFNDVARIPTVLRYVDHKDLRAIHMETIEGDNLATILDGTNEFPDNFNVDAFCEKLKKSIIRLNEGGIFHRDLLYNAGNIIIDKNGNPCIIDFGTAVKSAGSGVERDGLEFDSNSYRIIVDGRRMIGNDQACVEDFKRKILDRIKGQSYVE